jgi:amphiphysin
MMVSQMRIAETIDAFYGELGAEDLDAESSQTLNGPYLITVLESISRFCVYFPDVDECIKKRSRKLLEYDALRAKVKRLIEKPDKRHDQAAAH